MPILHSYYQDVYRCPIVRLDGYSAQHGLSTGILAYLDFGGATGSSKDGLAETMLAFATERGTLQPGMPVVEASSGSFGAALAVSCATTGHPCILVVPSNLPIAQRKRLQDLGAHIIACSSSGRRAMERVAEDTAKRYGGYYTHYFSNDDNPEYHRRVTGPQIYKRRGTAWCASSPWSLPSVPPSRAGSLASMAFRASGRALCRRTTTLMSWTPY